MDDNLLNLTNKPTSPTNTGVDPLPAINIGNNNAQVPIIEEHDLLRTVPVEMLEQGNSDVDPVQPTTDNDQEDLGIKVIKGPDFKQEQENQEMVNEVSVVDHQVDNIDSTFNDNIPANQFAPSIGDQTLTMQQDPDDDQAINGSQVQVPQNQPPAAPMESIIPPSIMNTNDQINSNGIIPPVINTIDNKLPEGNDQIPGGIQSNMPDIVAPPVMPTPQIDVPEQSTSGNENGKGDSHNANSVNISVDPLQSVNTPAQVVENTVTSVPVNPPVDQNATPKTNNIELNGPLTGKQEEVKKIFDELDPSKLNPVSGDQPMPDISKLNVSEKYLSETATIQDLLTITEQRDASDLHISEGYPPILRIDGDLTSMGGPVLTEDRIKQLFDNLLTEKQKQELERDLDIDFSYTHTSKNRFRINIFHRQGYLAGAFRLIPSRIKTVEELEMPPILHDFTQIAHGMVIVTGPTGSGKSTTLAAVINEINQRQPRHIVTVEDPIEYVFPKGKALVNQRELGKDTTSLKRALREVLREDPDVVLVGEMRDYETIAMTITTAETGHLVFSTLHTNSASQTIDRMIDVFPDAQQSQIRAQLANVISAVVAQRLVPIKSGGRKAVVEIMVATPAIRNAIREKKTYQIDNMIQTSSELGMITLEKSLVKLIRAGEITMEEAQAFTTKHNDLLSLMRQN